MRVEGAANELFRQHGRHALAVASLRKRGLIEPLTGLPEHEDNEEHD